MTESSPTRILLVEDDPKLSFLIKEFLESNGDFSVSIESRGDNAPSRIIAESPDLVVLDIMLPGMDGLTVCRKVRPHYGGPILMLTALSDEVDEVVGLEIGADDYMTKPASPRLLLARIKTLLRRASNGNARESISSKIDTTVPSRIEIGSVVVNQLNRTVSVNRNDVQVTTSEFDLLWLLATHAGKVLTREWIYKELRGFEWDGLDRSVDLRIARLRKKLGDDAKQPTLIKSVRGTGYLMAVGP